MYNKQPSTDGLGSREGRGFFFFSLSLFTVLAEHLRRENSFKGRRRRGQDGEEKWNVPCNCAFIRIR